MDAWAAAGTRVHPGLRVHLHPGSVGRWVLEAHPEAREAFRSLGDGSVGPIHHEQGCPIFIEQIFKRCDPFPS